ncbi:ABC transporter permease [Chitinophaga rhizosphaerae]|uniref:ABC transporter permease n=1 Tax=Chitinophaga rhizosphaerae TaxID=1864947 RepID=UPI000F802973|nr:DUF3526 domain-containing protein [Chitinophaga rhizosphaerae]
MKQIRIIAGLFLKVVFRNRALAAIYAIWLLLVAFAAATGWKTYAGQQGIRTQMQQAARQSWEANPDKHPHRMAHFGTFAFRQKHPLSMFDYGMESFTGNAVFLEAHKQNTVNFSEAGFSTGLLRFGEISLAMLVIVLLPLILFFLGFDAVARQKENGTLKILLIQGAGFTPVIWGNCLGMFVLAIGFLLPVVIAVAVLLGMQDAPMAGGLLRGSLLLAICLAYLWLAGVVAICVSARSDSGRTALLKLLGLWLFMTIVLPKTLQSAGSALFPAPGKIAFDTAVEKDVLAIGDSHNPNDPHFKHMKDSVLKANGVDSVQQLPFNYGGFVMREGERMSAEVYNAHLQGLYDIYGRQNAVSAWAAFADPVIGIRNLSMALSGTDFGAYRKFQDDAEAYRYQLAQTMNELQIEYIPNAQPAKNEKPHQIGREHWAEFGDFQHEFQPVPTVLGQELPAIVAVLTWFGLSFVLIFFTSRKAKAL